MVEERELTKTRKKQTERRKKMDKLTNEAFKAVRAGNIAKLKLLLDQGVDIDAHYKDKKGNDKETLLILAVKKGHVLMVDFLIANGADVLKTSPDCWKDAKYYSLRQPTEIFCIVHKAECAAMEANGYTYNPDYGDWEKRWG